MKKISTKNTSNPIISDFLSSSQWMELNSYNKMLDLSFFRRTEFDRDINQRFEKYLAIYKQSLFLCKILTASLRIILFISSSRL